MLTSPDFYINPRVSKQALNTFFAYFSDGKEELHTFSAYYRGDLLVRIAPAPYSADDKREIYSLSKSFCSTAIGFLCDEGKLSVEDKIVDLFPDKLPETVSENLAQMCVKHVLSMNTGHPSCVMPYMVNAEDAAKAFLSRPVEFVPGTHFAYNTGATCLLSCIVERLSGKKLADYLTEKLFMPLDICGVRWNSIADGTNEGGCGIHVNNDDIAKLGLLYAAGGMWKGKRILSEKWAKAATSFVSDNSSNGSPDWCAGYGYQFWMNAKEGFRGDGAFGQLCFVMPEHEMVFAVQTEVGNMQGEIDVLYALADHLLDENDGAQEVILPAYLPTGSAQKTAGFEHIVYALDPNPMGWTQMYFRYDTKRNAMQAFVCDGTDQFALTAGSGYFAESNVYTKNFKPKLVQLMYTVNRELCRFAASYTAEDGVLTYRVRYLNCPHRLTFTFRTEDDHRTLHADIDARGLIRADAVSLTGHAVR